MRHLAVDLLGSFAVTVDEEPATAFAYTKVRVLLAYLVLEPGRAQQRAELATLLWPDQPERNARSSLSQALTTLRSALGDRLAQHPLLLADTHQVQLDPRSVVTVDVTRFLAALDEAESHRHRSWRTCPRCAEQLRQALALYRGDFLADVAIADSPVFAEWASQHREHLRQRALSALERLVAYEQWRGNHDEALTFARRLVALAPLLEASLRTLMALLAANGEATEALAEYRQFRARLAEERGAVPEPASVELAERLAGRSVVDLLPAPLYVVAPPPNPIIGRDQELQALCARLREGGGRLVTITGTGGIGKTRLALEVASALRYEFEDGVYFVELAALNDPALVADTIAQVLRVKEQPRQPSAESVRDHLRTRHALLILDNFEHVVTAAPLVSELIAASPDLTVLVTSRAPLHVRNEQVYPLGPLLPPDEQITWSVAELGAVAAVKLFVQRARRVSPSFALTVDNAALVAAICRRLDGLPLALELTAPLVRRLDLPTLLARLDHALPLLSDGPHELPARQRTIEATLRWSYDLLLPDVQALFRCMAVFAGGVDLAAITAVGRRVGDELTVIELLDQLVAQSLVLVTVSGPGRMRYRLLEPVRQFALVLLEASGEATDVRRSHAEVYLQLAEQAHPHLRGEQQLIWLDTLGREHDNLRAALAWALQQGERETAARISWSLWPFWWIRAHQREGRRWTDAVRAGARGLSALAYRRVTMAAATMAYGQADDTVVQQLIDELVRLSAACGGDPHALAYASSGFGLLAVNRGAFSEALAHLETARQLLGQAGEDGMAAQAHVWIGTVLLLMGDHDTARSQFLTGLAAGHALGDRLSVTNAMFNLAQMALSTGDYHQAVRWLREGVPLSQQMDDRANVAHICEGLAIAATALGQFERAASLFGAAEGLIERIGLRGHTYYQLDRIRYDEALATLRLQFGEARLTSARAAGRMLSFEQAVAHALSVQAPPDA